MTILAGRELLGGLGEDDGVYWVFGDRLEWLSLSLVSLLMLFKSVKPL